MNGFHVLAIIVAVLLITYHHVTPERGQVMRNTTRREACICGAPYGDPATIGQRCPVHDEPEAPDWDCTRCLDTRFVYTATVGGGGAVGYRRTPCPNCTSGKGRRR